MQTESRSDWHTLPRDAVLAHLDARPEGLSPAEVAERQDVFGPNRLPEAGGPSALFILLRQFANPLTYILFAAAAVSGFLGHWSDVGFIAAVIVIDIVIGAMQEWRAESSAASLKKTLKISPTVVRAGVRRAVPIEDLVPGDVVLLESGSAVPADLRLLAAQDLRIDESLLTGESRPVEKDIDATPAGSAGVGDRANMAYAGAMVVSGRGTGAICATADRTQLGSIAKLLSRKGARPPLLVRMDAFTGWIAVATIALVLLIAGGQILRGAAIEDIFLLAIALAISAIPEGLPMAVTVALSIASARMAKRDVIVRRLPAVEALGSCTLIATDKTGTLTANRLTVKKLAIPGSDQFDVAGEGLELEGEILRPGGAVFGPTERDALKRLATAAALTNDADLRIEGGAVEVQGDAVDVAFLVLAAKLGLRRTDLLAAHPVRASIPYEPKHSYSASENFTGEGRLRLSVKGAPEVVLPMCDGLDLASAHRQVEDMAASGYRVIAVAEGENHQAVQGSLSHDHLTGLRFLGLAGLVDPLRSEAAEAVAEARAAGIDVRMITGDHPETALAIARQLDPSWAPTSAITGADLERLEGDAREQAIRDAAIFARVEPAHKLTIVTGLQKAGHFVAVTGDGVNDAPALNAADVGVAMGASGTDVARAASDLILTDDNFASIVAGIEEGRTAYDNIRKIVWLLISTAISEVVLFLLALGFDTPMPLTAVQILWLNLIAEGVQDVALAFERREPGIMERGPRSPREPMFDRRMIEQCASMGLFVGVLAFSLFEWLRGPGGYGLEDARNLTLLFLVSFNNVHVLNCRSETRSFFRIPVRSNPVLIASIVGAQAVHIGAMHAPILHDILNVAPATVVEWAGVVGLAATTLIVAEAYKLLRARPLAARLHHPQRI